MPHVLLAPLTDRAGARCELCEEPAGLDVCVLDGTTDAGRAVLACGPCRDALAGSGPLEPTAWFALQGAAWSEVLPVQVACWRLLARIDADWAMDLRDQLAFDPTTRGWAEAGGADAPTVVVDANGTPLSDGDTVTVIKDLPVKGGGFTVKRGTVVKGVRLGDDPTHVEGKVNGTAIYLKTAFLKRA